MAKNRTSPAALWPLDKLVPYSKNPRTHSDAQIAQLADSIEEFGFANPVLVDTKAGILEYFDEWCIPSGGLCKTYLSG